MRYHATLLIWIIVPVLATITGCEGDADSRTHHVKGTVTFKGKPVPAGTIQFVPSKDNSGPPGSAEIKNGQYDTSLLGGQGTVGGAHTVIIQGFDGNAKPDEELLMGKPLFKEYKVDYDVPKEAGASQDFTVTENRSGGV